MWYLIVILIIVLLGGILLFLIANKLLKRTWWWKNQFIGTTQFRQDGREKKYDIMPIVGVE